MLFLAHAYVVFAAAAGLGWLGREPVFAFVAAVACAGPLRGFCRVFTGTDQYPQTIPRQIRA